MFLIYLVFYIKMFISESKEQNLGLALDQSLSLWATCLKTFVERLAKNFMLLLVYRGGSRLSYRTHMRQSEFEIYVLGLYISFIPTPISNSNCNISDQVSHKRTGSVQARIKTCNYNRTRLYE